MSTETTLAAHTLVGLLRQQAARYGDKVAFRYCPDGLAEQRRLTYRELDLQARAVAAHLQHLGAAGQRVLLTTLPGLDTIPAFFGCLYAGAIVVAVGDDGLRLKAVVPDAEPNFVLVAAEAEAKVKPAVDRLTGGRHPQWCVLDEILEDAENWADRWATPDIDPNATALIEYTSGSTGSPKGVLVSHRSILSNIDALHQVWGGDEQTIMLSWVSLHRNAGLMAATILPLYLGCSAVVVSPVTFFTRPMRWLEAISHHRATVTVAYSRVYGKCVKHSTPAAVAALDLSCLDTATAGGEPISAADVHAFTDTFAPVGFRPEALAPSYGLAQATMAVTGGTDALGPVVQHLDRTALGSDRVADAAPNDPLTFDVVSSGKPFPGVQLVIVDPETLRKRGPDEVGEIWIAGPNVAQAYWRNPQETERTFSAFISDTGEGPFLRSGDLGFLRAGELFVTGRWSDLITVDNSNHYPGDIETTVQKCHPAFASGGGVAFAVKPNPRAESHLVIVQEVEPDHQLSQSELSAAIEAVRAEISERHGIEAHDVVLVEQTQIPTAGGKVRRGQCREQFVNGELKPVAEWHAAPPDPRAAPVRPPGGVSPLARVLGRLVERVVAGNRSTGQPFKTKLKYLSLYNYTTRHLEPADVIFLNYGYEEDPPTSLPLLGCDEPDEPGKRSYYQSAARLYHQLTAEIDFEAKNILEVSSGHGGGAAHLARTFRPASYTGLDFNAAAVAFCRRRHQVPGLDFVHGDAHKLPFPDRSFDVVINLEASNGYDLGVFLSEVARVLRPGGHFRYADVRSGDEIPAWEAALSAAPMRLVTKQVINEQALRSLRQNSAWLIEMIDGYAPPELQEVYREFSSVVGSENHQKLTDGVSSYRIYRFVKG